MLCLVIPKRNSVFMFPVPLFSQSSAAGSVPSPPESAREVHARNTYITVLDIPHMEFELYGNQFCFRATERAGRKFKHKETIEL